MCERNIIFWGTYDTGKPRVRLLLQAAKHLGYQPRQIHSHIWQGIEDKSQLKGFRSKLKKITQLLLAYPGLLYRYYREPKHQHIIIPYLGVLDVLVLWPWAKLRGATIHWDVFLSLYDTVVHDRKILPAKHPLSLILYASEWIASRLADTVFMDTAAHAAYFASLYRLPNEKTHWIPVGVEASIFPRVSKLPEINLNKIQVLFYGQFIPLHGIDTILNAAALDNSGRIDWLLVGKGQLSTDIDQRIVEERLDTIRRIKWVEYEQLIELIRQSDICLGIFGTSNKAKNVIPNKIYQIMAAGKPFITADTAGMASLQLHDNPAVRLTASGDAHALLSAVHDLANMLHGAPQQVFTGTKDLPIVDVPYVAKQLERLLG